MLSGGLPTTSPPEIHVTVGPKQVGVVVKLSDVQVAINLPAAGRDPQLNDEQLRAAVLRQARRALEVARAELEHEAHPQA